eukprot:TRINITY_DN10889_c0_g1_i2.p1 TRINITY_DN10889_c0_g1~~TRINITY_DN10889_c0_g1_i2.p1  ORF type:complete len:538 (-),score=204.80 TRINITY_DN10889_c0_g1_i2:19-1455(-)
MSTKQQLEELVKLWKDVAGQHEPKVVLTEAAKVAGVTIPEDAKYVQYPDERAVGEHPLVVGFQNLNIKNKDVSHAASTDGVLYKKHLNLFGAGLPRDKLFELRNLHLMNFDIHSFCVVQDGMEKILFQNAEENVEVLGGAIRDILDELAETKDRYLEYNADNNQKEVDSLVWLRDGVFEKYEPLAKPDGDHELALREFKAFLKVAYDRVYHIKPRILTLKSFSFEKKLVDGDTRWNLVLVTDNLGRNLKTFLEQYRGRRGNVFYQRQALDILIQVTECLTFLHESHYLHGDLKDDNFFVVSSDPNNLDDIQIYLGDLGQSRLGDVTKANYGYPPFKAPEFSNGRSKKTDIYALGMTFLQIISPNEMRLWENRFTEHNVITPDLANGDRPKILDMNPALTALITECLGFEPGDRPHAWEILRRLREIKENIDPNALVPSEGKGDLAEPLEGVYAPSDLPGVMGSLQISQEPDSGYVNSV